MKAKRLSQSDSLHWTLRLLAQKEVIAVEDEQGRKRLVKPAEGAIHGGGQWVDIFTGDVLMEDE